MQKSFKKTLDSKFKITKMAASLQGANESLEKQSEARSEVKSRVERDEEF
ncbi:hypothetical protein GCM10010919_29090 [Alishewanella longhuensis]|uniref:Uncharacterized protein n=1 Tax=Alishewanella longhuensis TaxID=1091037 RepID=A0ABQ3L1B4_9ALTE|nr:hypothetical protein GCM10010919_29090 [Alishewanella longhuensis]